MCCCITQRNWCFRLNEQTLPNTFSFHFDYRCDTASHSWSCFLAETYTFLILISGLSTSLMLLFFFLLSLGDCNLCYFYYYFSLQLMWERKHPEQFAVDLLDQFNWKSFRCTPYNHFCISVQPNSQ